MPSTIFIIDSSPAVRRMVEQISTPEGFTVVGFHDGPTALDAARKLPPKLIIADYHLDSMTFSGFCKEVYKLDSLSETFIISLVSAADRLDEAHLRSLGVKAFLKKPFQAEHLLDLIKDLDQTKTDQSNGGRKKRQTWPPVSSATHSDSDDESAEALFEEDQTGEIEAQHFIPSPVQKDAVMAATSHVKHQAAEPEETMKGLLGQLLQSMSEKAEKTVSELLPAMMAKDLTREVAKAVETEVRRQLGSTLTRERLVDILEPLMAKELPKALARELPILEPIIRHSVFEIATPQIKEHIQQLMREHIGTLDSTVPDLVRDHLKTFDGQILEEVRKTASMKIEQVAEELVRAAAADQVRQTVQRVVPDLAEEQIKIEIKRLSEAA